MGDEDVTRPRQPPGAPAPRTNAAPRANPPAAPIPRRRVLALLGTTAGALALGSGLGALLAACAGPPVTIVLDLDPETLVPGTPTEIPFSVTFGSSTVDASVWMVRKVSGELTAFDPRCTHGLCRYRWSAATARFTCLCHDGQFALDGTVLAGPPPRPLGTFPVRVVGDGIEMDVPGDFQAPRSSLPA